MNTLFRAPLVESARGGASGGGANLTEDGRQVLVLYRTLEARTREAGATEISGIEELLRDMLGEK